jgi:hypothetical protein
MCEKDGAERPGQSLWRTCASARSARHAVKLARQRRCQVGLVTLLTIWPFAEDVIARSAVPTHRAGDERYWRSVGAWPGDTRWRVNRADGEMARCR